MDNTMSGRGCAGPDLQLLRGAGNVCPTGGLKLNKAMADPQAEAFSHERGVANSSQCNNVLMRNILYSILLVLVSVHPPGAMAHDSSRTGLGSVPSGMGLGTAPGGKLDRKQDLSVSRKKHRDKAKDFHHGNKQKPPFHGSRIRFRPHQIFIIQDPEARHRAKRSGELTLPEQAETDAGSGMHRSFDQLRGDFAGSRPFEEIRSEFIGSTK